MSPNKAEALIMRSFPKCPICEEMIDSWIDASDEYPGKKIEFVLKDKVFGGMCTCYNIIEFYLSELSKGDVIPHLLTERTLGRPVSQEDCIHGKTMPMEVPHGMTVPTEDGLKEGPFKGMYDAESAE